MNNEFSIFLNFTFVLKYYKVLMKIHLNKKIRSLSNKLQQ